MDSEKKLDPEEEKTPEEEKPIPEKSLLILKKPGFKLKSSQSFNIEEKSDPSDTSLRRTGSTGSLSTSNINLGLSPQSSPRQRRFRQPNIYKSILTSSDELSIKACLYELADESCPSNVAKEMLKLAAEDKKIRTLFKKKAHPKYTNLYCNLLNSVIRESSYEEAIKLLLQHHTKSRSSSGALTILRDLLFSDEKFLASFLADQTYGTLFDKEFLTIACNGLPLEVAKQIESKKRNDAFLDFELSRLYGFSSLTDKELDILQIVKFLTDRDRVDAQLLKLEELLEIAAEDRFDKESMSLKDYAEGIYLKQNKLLTNFFLDWAKENLPGLAIFRKELELDEFFATLAEGILFKDVFFRGSGHGEWAHFIQWWCIIEANKENRFLENDPIDLIKWIGEGKRREIWNHTFEVSMRESIFSPKFDMRSVIKFNKYLFSKDAPAIFPILYQLVKSRQMEKPTSSQAKEEETEEKIPSDRKRETKEPLEVKRFKK